MKYQPLIIAKEKELVLSQFECAEFRSEVSFHLQATDFMQFEFLIIQNQALLYRKARSASN